MSLTNPDKVITEERLSQFYGSILPYLGGVPEAIANKFSKGDLYSTDEKMIGQWIDGKPLYQKVITPNISTSQTMSMGSMYSGSLDISSLIPNIDMAWVITDHSYYEVSDTVRGFPFAWYEGNSNIWFTTISSRSNVPAHFLIQYTKTTDSAISIGSDTDYSATEKIVGTWINGKPLYQKTFSGSSPTKATPFNTGLVNCANAMIVDGYLTTSSNNNYDIGLYLMPASDGSKLIYHSSDTGYTGKPFVCTLQYTKTTD